MAVKRILLLGNPALRQVCRPVTDTGAPEIRTLIADLADTLADFRSKNGFGRGIAAPQIGVAARLVVTNTDGLRALVNPEIVRAEGRQWVWDDCFSLPGLVVRLRRAQAVAVRYLDETGRERRIEAAGDLAELLQHEIDHLDGRLTIDHAQSVDDIWYREEAQRLVPPAEPAAQTPTTAGTSSSRPQKSGTNPSSGRRMQ